MGLGNAPAKSTEILVSNPDISFTCQVISSLIPSLLWLLFDVIAFGHQLQVWASFIRGTSKHVWHALVRKRGTFKLRDGLKNSKRAASYSPWSTVPTHISQMTQTELRFRQMVRSSGPNLCKKHMGPLPIILVICVILILWARRRGKILQILNIYELKRCAH